MPIGLGVASSHAPGMYRPKEMVKPGFDQMMARMAERGHPTPTIAKEMTEEKLHKNWDAFRAGHGALRAQMEKYNPDAVIIVGGDQNEMFDNSNKINIAIFTGAEAFGLNSGFGFAGMTDEKYYTHYKTDVKLAQWLAGELVTKEHFDVAVSGEMKPMGGRKVAGLPHAFVNIAEILHKKDVPTVLVYENTYDPPTMVSAARCYELGKAMARVLKNDPRKIAILGSGGLSHDPGGPRNIWIDAPLDRWVLDQISRGNGEALKDMYQFDSMTLRGGTGEIRAWITVAGAMEYMGAKATVVDYMDAAPETQTGIGFAYWLPNKN